MALIDEKVNYEVLLRYNENGELCGAHQIKRRRVILDGELLQDSLLPAEPLDISTIGEFLSQETIDAINQVNELTNKVEQLQNAAQI